MSSTKFSKGREVSGIIFLAAAILLGITYYVPGASTGLLGDVFLGLGRGLFGVTAFALPALFLYMALEYFISRSRYTSSSRITHVFIMLMIVACLLHAFSIEQANFRVAMGSSSNRTATNAIRLLWESSRGYGLADLGEGSLPGGLLPGLLTLSLQSVAGDTGAIILLAMAFIVELVLLFNVSFSNVLGQTGSAVKHAGQKMGTALSQTVHSATLRRNADKRYDFALEKEAWEGDSSFNAQPLEAFDEDNEMPAESNVSNTIQVTAAAGETDQAKTEPYRLDVSTYKPNRQSETPSPTTPVSASGAGFHQVGSADPEGKALLSKEDQDQLASYPKPDEELSAGREAQDPKASNSYFEGIPILSYDPEPEQHGLVVGAEVKTEEDPFAVPAFLQEAQTSKSQSDDTVVRPQREENWDFSETDNPTESQAMIRPGPVSEQKAAVAEGQIANRYGAKIETGQVRAVTAEQIADLDDDDFPAKPYILPSSTLLNQEDRTNFKQNQDQIAGLGRKLEETLKSFGVEAKVVNITTGPSITRFELTPGIGVKVSKITNLADDIALNLAAVGVRIEAPIPGKAAIGIEIPNKKTTIVGLRALIESRDFREAKSKLTVALGRDIPGAPILSDLARMPHLLIAGATGSGKSVCINSILVSILYRANPNEVKLLMIDPKVVELSVYNGIPHLLAPVVTDPKKAANTLNWAVVEMTRRYDLFAKKNVRDLSSYNTVAERDGFEKVPHMVIVIDELADLMIVAPHEVEDSIARLTAMARAAGMHLIIATQRPSVDVITGVIKANIPSRVAFMVSSQVDSRTILDQGGAEKLLGKGDMLYAPQSAPKPVRGQGAFITEEEVERVVKFCKDQNDLGYDEELQEEIVSAQPLGQSKSNADTQDQDELFTEAVDIIVDAGYASVSILQRRLNVGYPRAGKLIDSMEQAGYIGPFEGSKPRKLLLTRPQWEQIKMGGDSADEE